MNHIREGHTDIYLDRALMHYTGCNLPDSSSVDVTILIDNKSYDELEQEAMEAERIALEAQRRAQALREALRRQSASLDI